MFSTVRLLENKGLMKFTSLKRILCTNVPVSMLYFSQFSAKCSWWGDVEGLPSPAMLIALKS